MQRFVLSLAALATMIPIAACASGTSAGENSRAENGRGENGRGENRRGENRQADVAAPDAQQWESWPPANVAPRNSAGPAAATGPVVRMVPKDGGWRVEELFENVNKVTGISILYDSNNATFKQAKIEFVGVHVIPESELFQWLQAVLSYRKLVLVPVGPKSPDGKQQWFVMDQADPSLKSRPVFIDESEVLDYAERDGLYVVTTLRCRDTVDTTRVRNALSPLSTQTAGIGRIQDIPGSRSVIIGDFAPVVAAMKRVLDLINAATPPSAVRPPAPPTPQPPPKPDK